MTLLLKALAVTLTVLVFAVVFAVLIAAVLSLCQWAIRDARQRGKSPWFVLIAVFLFFPWGLVAWLLFRPDLPGPRDPRPAFRLSDYRLQ
jgi:hypothetical protein